MLKPLTRDQRAPAPRTLMSLTFAAIDVETANSHRGSICAFGVALVTDREITATHHLLTQPPRELNWFDPFNTGLHSIGPATVANEPEFAIRLQQVLALVGDLPVVAHNAAFDIGAIRQACVADHLDWPHLTYACSLVMARRAGLGLLSYRLPIVCEALGVTMGRHHDAGADAQAAAGVVVALAARRSLSSLTELATSFMVRIGTLTPTLWADCIASLLPNQRAETNPDADPDHPLFGKLVAFTGGLSITRVEASALIAALGAVPQNGPNKHTDFLVIGDGFTGHTVEDFHTGKALAAAKANAKHAHIEVLTEADLLTMLAEPATYGERQVLPA
jgi:DNA polymerase-3 subunit epsilon